MTATPPLAAIIGAVQAARRSSRRRLRDALLNSRLTAHVAVPLLALAPRNKWLHELLIQSMTHQACGALAIDHLITAAADPGADPAIAHIPFPAYLLTRELCTKARADALRDIVRRHPTATGARLFLARMLSYLGAYPEATALLRGVFSAAEAGADSGRQPHPPTRAKPPEFLLIGQAKAGTTALFSWLCRHPDIAPPIIKEIHYWSEFPDAGTAWYRAHFPPIPETSTLICGDASTTYLTHPDAPRKVAAELPLVKLIVLLRDPVARAYSEYRMFIRLGWEDRDWATVVDAELAGLPDCPLDEAQLAGRQGMAHRDSYLWRSAALPYLKRWLSVFPPRQMLILPSAELFADPPVAVGRVLEYLGLQPFGPGRAKPVNEGHYPPMDATTEQRLRTWFAPHQAALTTFLATLDPERTSG